MKTLGGLSLLHLRRQKLRAVLGGGGIVLGVAVLMGSIAAISSTEAAFDRLIEDLVGRADVIASPVGGTGETLPTDLVARLEAAPEVTAAVGVVALPTALRAPSGTQTAIRNVGVGSLQLVGLDLAQATRLYDFRLEAGRAFSDDPPELVIPGRLARELDVDVGDSLEVGTSAGVIALPLVGVLADEGAGRFNFGDVAYTSTTAARGLGGVGPGPTTVLVDLAEGVEKDDWIEAQGARLAGGAEFVDARASVEGPLSTLTSGLVILAALGMLVLFIAAIVLHLSVSAAVAERRQRYGLLYALGATPPQVLRLVLYEALVVGTVTTAAGIALGVLVARGIFGLTEAALPGTDFEGVSVSPTGVAMSATVGIVAVVAASLGPAVRASRLDPVEAIQGADHLTPRRTGVASLAGLATLAGGTALAAAGPPRMLGAAFTLLAAGAALTMPLLFVVLISGPWAMLRARRRSAAVVAVAHLARERRSASAATALTLTFAMAFALLGARASFHRSEDLHDDAVFGADLQLSSPSGFSPAFLDALAGVPGVAAISPMTFLETKMLAVGDVGADSPVSVRVIDPDRYFDVSSFWWQAGNDSRAQQALRRQSTVLIPEGLARSHDIHRGEHVALQTPHGAKKFAVAEIYASASVSPTVVMSANSASAYFGALRITDVHLNAGTNESVEQVKAAIQRRLGRAWTFAIRTAPQVKQQFKAQIDVLFIGLASILVFGLLAGILGLANTLVLSTLNRRREIGTIIALGAQTRHLVTLATAESFALVGAAFVVAVPLGVLLTRLANSTISTSLGPTLNPTYPWRSLTGIALLAAAAALAASAPSIRRLTSLDPVEALRHE